MIKVYVQNGYNKRVMGAPNLATAIKRFLKSLLVKTGENLGKEVGEIGEFHPIVMASDYGFYDDIVAVGNQEKLDEVMMVSTATCFKKMGRKDMAEWMVKKQKSLPKGVQALLEILP